jgi:tetratricopeptide (TPR) repeat protein
LAKTLINLGALYAEHQPDKASEQYEKAAAAQKRALELRPNDAVYLSDLVLAYNNLGMAQSRQEALAQAAETYAKVRDLSGELLRQSPSQKSYKYLRAVGFNNLGQAHNRMVGQATVAESDFRQALALQETLVKQDPADVQCQSALGGMYNNLGTVLEETKRPEDAVQAYEQAVAHQRVALASAPEVAHYRQLLSMHYFNYGRTLRQIGRPGDAAHIDLARRQLWPNDPQNLVSVAEDLASDARDLAKNGFASDINADACGAYAVETLKQATAAGWKPDPNSNWTKKFLAIKNRADFMALTKN